MTPVDLNADVGEGMDSDEHLFPLITSANIACGAHAGSPDLIRTSVRLAIAAGVAIGAHPGFADRENFGRSPERLTSDELCLLVGEQVRLVRTIVDAEGGRLAHVKPHGALYNMAAGEVEIAEAIARSVRDIDPTLILVGLAGSELIRAGARHGLPTASEAFADRRYRADGTLVPRGTADALISDVAESVDQAVSLVQNHVAHSIEGRDVRVEADTICLHGDGPNAVALARAIRTALEALGVVISPVRQSGRRA